MKGLLLLPLILFPLAGAYLASAIHASGLTVYYSVIIVKTPSWYPLNISDSGKLYGLAKYPGYAALVEVDYGRGSVSFPEYYAPNNYLPPELKKAIVGLFKDMSSPRSSLNEKNIEVYYLNSESSEMLYACDRAVVDEGPGYQIAYGQVPVKGVVEVGSGEGYKVAVVFNILQASGPVCGKPVNVRAVSYSTTLLAVLALIFSVKSYLDHR